MSQARANYDFSGQVANVTGGTQGIGASIVQRLRAGRRHRQRVGPAAAGGGPR